MTQSKWHLWVCNLVKVRLLFSFWLQFSAVLQLWSIKVVSMHCVLNPPMPKVEATPKGGGRNDPVLRFFINYFCPVLIPPISFAYLFLSIKCIFWYITHHSTLDSSGLSGPRTYRIIPINLHGISVDAEIITNGVVLSSRACLLSIWLVVVRFLS